MRVIDGINNFMIIFFSKYFSDNNVMGLLHLGDLYKVRKVIDNCEEFLLEDSQKVLKEKFQSAIDFKMEELKVKIMNESLLFFLLKLISGRLPHQS